jgi:hypothetical protein
MFNAKFVSRSSGTSSKTGREWYKVELIATTVDGGAKVLQEFCTRNAYEGAAELAAMQDCKVACGVTQTGYLTVCGIRKGV